MQNGRVSQVERCVSPTLCPSQQQDTYKNRHSDQWDRIESPEMDPQTYDPLIFDKAGKNTQWNKDTLFKRCWENWTATCRKMKLGPLSYTIHNNKLKMDERPKWKTGRHQIREEKAGKSVFNLGRSNFLLDTSPEARETKAKMNYWDCIKIKSFCTAKETISKTKRQPMEWEKIFANDISDKGLASKIHKELLKLNTQKTTNPVKKWANDMKRHFSKEDIQMANRHMKRCSASLIIREIHIKTTVRYHLTPVRMANINNSGNNRCWRGCGERGSPLHCWWECRLVQPL